MDTCGPGDRGDSEQRHPKPGGTNGFSLKSEAVARYYLSLENQSGYLRQLRDMIGQHDSDFIHLDLQVPRIRRDEVDVQSLFQLVETSWLNPFNPDQVELVSLSTATTAPPDMAKDRLDAHTIGEEAYQAFKQERLEVDAPPTQFHNKIKKNKLKTFTDIKKKPRS